MTAASSSTDFPLDLSTRSTREKRIPIWSCHGGGVRVLIPLIFARKLEQRLETAIPFIFPSMGGISAGAMLNACLATPSFAEDSPNRNEWSAQTLHEHFPHMMREVFPKPNLIGSVVRTVRSILYPKYDEESRNQAIHRYVGDTLLCDALSNLVTPVAMVGSYEPYVYTRTRAREIDKYKNLPLSEVCEAATAAPTFFKPKELIPHDYEEVSACMDYAIACNNPALATWTHTANEHGFNRKYTIVSVGTGRVPKDLITKDRMDRMGWGSSPGDLFQMMGQIVSASVDANLRDIVGEENFFPFDIDMERSHFQMDNVSDENFKSLEELGQTMIEENEDTIDELCHGPLKQPE